MSKRFIFPQQSGDRKKPRLDISVSDHNFPLSQSAGFNYGPGQADEWGDDIDDEVLLQASQACEQACSSSTLPEYSQFMPPAVTSTQLPDVRVASTPKGGFTFKKPTTGYTNTVSTLLRDRCDRISSPLRGISANVAQGESINSTDNFSSDAVLNTRDTDYVYRQLLQLKEENAKLKSENGKLLEKCVTKEGEASILRTQLKSHQVAVDNARLEKIKTQEEARLHWSEKLNAVNNQMAELRTQLDFKNLEVISMKEKCKMLESNKIKLTQITVAGNEMTRLNTSGAVPNNILCSQTRKLKTASTVVQTDNIPKFLKLSKGCILEKSKLTQILPLIMDSATDQQHSILDYNEKLKKPNDLSPNKCRIFSTFYRLSPGISCLSNTSENKISISCIYEDLTTIAASNDDVDQCRDQYIHIFNVTEAVLTKVQSQLESISRRLTSAFQKEMDKVYIEATTTYTIVDDQDLFVGKALFKEEQSILARRMTAILQNILGNAKAVHFFNKTQRPVQASKTTSGTNEFFELLYRICTLLDNNSCGILYSGLLLSIILLVENVTSHCQLQRERGMEVIKRVISSRPLGFVPCRLLRVLCRLRSCPSVLCSDNSSNLRVDYDQGVLMYKKDSCLLQVLLRQVESSLKCMEGRGLARQAADTARDLLQLHRGYGGVPADRDKPRCKCSNILSQVVVYALKICSSMLVSSQPPTPALRAELLAVCRGGLRALYRCAGADAEFASHLAHGEGHLVQFCDDLRALQHNEFYDTMLSEIMGSFQAAAEDAPSSFHRQAWRRSFDTFSHAD